MYIWLYFQTHAILFELSKIPSAFRLKFQSSFSRYSNRWTSLSQTYRCLCSGHLQQELHKLKPKRVRKTELRCDFRERLLVMTKSLRTGSHGHRKFVDLPSYKNGDFPVRKLFVYWRVMVCWSMANDNGGLMGICNLFLWESHVSSVFCCWLFLMMFDWILSVDHCFFFNYCLYISVANWNNHHF